MYVAMATRDYGEGKILIHTDRLSGKNSSSGQNNLSFWRDIIEFTSSKYPREHINIGYINFRPNIRRLNIKIFNTTFRKPYI